MTEHVPTRVVIRSGPRQFRCFSIYVANGTDSLFVEDPPNPLLRPGLLTYTTKFRRSSLACLDRMFLSVTFSRWYTGNVRPGRCWRTRRLLVFVNKNHAPLNIAPAKVVLAIVRSAFRSMTQTADCVRTEDIVSNYVSSHYLLQPYLRVHVVLRVNLRHACGAEWAPLYFKPERVKDSFRRKEAIGCCY